MPSRGSQHFTAGDKIRCGPQVGRVATYPLPHGGGGGVPNASKRGQNQRSPNIWAGCLHNPCRLGGSQHFRTGDKIRGGQQVCGGYIPLAAWGSPTFQSGGQNQRCPTSGPGGYITPAIWGFPTLHSGGQNETWPTSGPGGYIPLAAWGGGGVPNASKRGQNQRSPNKWATWLHNPCRLGGSQRFTAGDKIRSGPTSGPRGYIPLAAWGVPNASKRGQNQRCPTSGPCGYITPAVSGVPNASERGQNQKRPNKLATWLHTPCRLGGPQRFRAGSKSEVAHKWATWLHNPYRLGGPQCFRTGTKSEVAPTWAGWLHNPCRVGGSQRLRARTKSEVAQQVGRED